MNYNQIYNEVIEVLGLTRLDITKILILEQKKERTTTLQQQIRDAYKSYGALYGPDHRSLMEDISDVLESINLPLSIVVSKLLTVELMEAGWCHENSNMQTWFDEATKELKDALAVYEKHKLIQELSEEPTTTMDEDELYLSEERVEYVCIV